MKTKHGNDNKATMDLDAMPWRVEESLAPKMLMMEIVGVKCYTISIYELHVMLILLCTLFVAL